MLAHTHNAHKTPTRSHKITAMIMVKMMMIVSMMINVMLLSDVKDNDDDIVLIQMMMVPTVMIVYTSTIHGSVCLALSPKCWDLITFRSDDDSLPPKSVPAELQW